MKELKPKISTSLTVPQEFRFCTDTRVRSHQADYITPHTTSKVSSHIWNSTHNLNVVNLSYLQRSSISLIPILYTLYWILILCVHFVYPQTLQRSQSIQVGRAVSPFISIAERVRRFQQKTPERFHMMPSGVSSHKVELVEKPKLKLTRPKTPELETMQRSRPPRWENVCTIGRLKFLLAAVDGGETNLCDVWLWSVE